MSPEIEALVNISERWAALGHGWSMRLRVGPTRTGLVWVAMSRDEEHKHTGVTLAEACEAWLHAHPLPMVTA